MSFLFVPWRGHFLHSLPPFIPLCLCASTHGHCAGPLSYRIHTQRLLYYAMARALPSFTPSLPVIIYVRIQTRPLRGPTSLVHLCTAPCLLCRGAGKHRSSWVPWRGPTIIAPLPYSASHHIGQVRCHGAGTTIDTHTHTHKQTQVDHHLQALRERHLANLLMSVAILSGNFFCQLFARSRGSSVRLSMCARVGDSSVDEFSGSSSGWLECARMSL